MTEPAAERRWGQNFLTRPDIAARIAQAGGPPDVMALEIGPGPGALTQALLEAGYPKVVAIERDPRFAASLAAMRTANPRLAPVIADALRALVPLPSAHRIVANLPFNVASPLIAGWISPEVWPPRWLSLTVLVQREVAERIIAQPNTRAWGRLGALVAWRCHAHIALHVPADAFRPQPKVAAALVRLTPRADALALAPAKVSAALRLLFAHRRKTLAKALSATLAKDPTLLTRLGVDPRARAETLDITRLLAIAQAIRD